MVGVAGAPSLMLSVLHTNVIARQYFILSFNVVALCFIERTLHFPLNCTNRPTLLFSSKNTDITHDEFWLFVLLTFPCQKGTKQCDSAPYLVICLSSTDRCWGECPCEAQSAQWRAAIVASPSCNTCATKLVCNIVGKSTQSSYRTRNIVMVLVGLGVRPHKCSSF